MESNIYFQWQNPALVKTIYPLREMKLRDFLYYFQEIDLWKVYQNKTLDDLADEVRIHRETQARIVRAAVEELDRLQAYFLQPDVRAVYAADFPDLDEDELKKIHLIHASFARYYPKLNHPRKEKYFIAQQVLYYEPRRAEITQRIAQRQRRLNAIRPDHPTRPDVMAEIEKLKTVSLPMAEREYCRLRDLLSAHAKLESRKMEIAKSRDQARIGQRALAQRLDQNLARQRPLSDQRRSLMEDLKGLKNPPDLAPLEHYFLEADVSGELQSAFPLAGADHIRVVQDLHRTIQQAFRYTKTTSSRIVAVRNYIYDVNRSQRAFDRQIRQLQTNLRNMGPTWKRKDEVEVELQGLLDSQPVLEEEVRRLTDYQAALRATSITPAEKAKQIKDKETKLAGVEKQLEALVAEARDLNARLDDADRALNTPEAEQLLSAGSEKPLTVRDIVRGKLEAYREELGEKDQFALLEDVYRRFSADPERYPLWLQYMVVHFSGMRYKSAHGSWADPRDLLANLRTAGLEKDFNALGDDAKDAILEQKLQVYAPGEADSPDGETAAPAGETAAPAPPLARAKSPAWAAKADRHLQGLRSTSVYRRRKALFELLADEVNYDVEQLTDDQVLEALEAMRDTLPDWMWKEIVRVTSLKLKYVEDENWEIQDAKEQAEKSDYRWQEYRLMISKWKQAHTTGWREEHDRSNQLIVTRAVCNEVAEHIQHIRGNSPPGGLTAKPKWYQGLENAWGGKPALPGDQKPHFAIARAAEDFTPGASVLWLRFVNEMPNPWRIANPMTLKSGEGLLPAAMFRGAQDGGWVYQQQGSVISRKRNLLNEKKRKVGEEQQYLRWIHEATVVEVAETADGPVVLTFETALPNEDRRLSSIGVFRHDLSNIVYRISGEWFNASFIGYTPEGDVPQDDLDFMLDWNLILRRDPDQKAGRRAAGNSDFADKAV